MRAVKFFFSLAGLAIAILFCLTAGAGFYILAVGDRGMNFPDFLSGIILAAECFFFCVLAVIKMADVSRDYARKKRWLAEDKAEELKRIAQRVAFHPDKRPEESIAAAAQGMRYWKAAHLIKIWKDIYQNAYFRVYR